MGDNEIVTGFVVTDMDMNYEEYQFVLGEWCVYDVDALFAGEGFFFFKYRTWALWSHQVEEIRLFKAEARSFVKDDEEGTPTHHFAREIRLVEEIVFSMKRKNIGKRNKGRGNLGSNNKGSWNEGDENDGDRNIGNNNVGVHNIGDWNRGDWNLGDSNRGDRNTGSWNRGDWNRGYSNIGKNNKGYGNLANNCTGSFCTKDNSTAFFDEPTPDQNYIDHVLALRLSIALTIKYPIRDISKYLALPNATEEKIKALHAEHIKRRQNKKENAS